MLQHANKRKSEPDEEQFSSHGNDISYLATSERFS